VKIAITGSDGFLGWHARCALKARGIETTPINRTIASDADRLDVALHGVDAVLHLAGVNRGEDRDLRDVNVRLAHELTAAMDRADVRPVVVFANSIQAGNDTPFGDGKQAAAEHLAAWGSTTGAPVSDVRLPNLFGEHGRPHYNSVVATFCHELVTGGAPVIIDDRDLLLLHVQDATATLIDLALDGVPGVIWPEGRTVQVSQVLGLLREFSDIYSTGDIPDLTDPLHLALFNTYRSFCFPQKYPLFPQVRSDPRGALFECLRASAGPAQVFCSSTMPGQTRGEHFHLRKIERFVVLRGRGEIALRRLFDDVVVRFTVSGEVPAMVDMPTMWAHSITNTGDEDLVTLFWADQIFDPDRPDTYQERVVS
jgi:UDP-2-acetamido-2,6-beta-L-arabino-hexul-4-ose reductase